MAEFKEYIAATKFNIGQDKENNLVVSKGTPVEYDGTIAKIAGKEYNFPKLESAIKARWLVDIQELGLDGEADFQPQSAEISMRHPTKDDGEPTIASTASMTDEERPVGTIDNFREGKHKVQSASGQQGQEVQGVSLKTAAGEKSKNSTTRVDQLGQNAISNIERGSERADKKRHFEELERQKMEREIASLKRQLQADKKPKQQVREGVQFNNEGISQTAADTTDQVEQQTVNLNGSDATVVSQATQSEEVEEDFDVENKQARLAVARQMMPNFDWDFGDHWKTKLKTLNDDGRPLYVCAVYAVESEAMKKHIANQFPELELGE